MKKYMWIMVSLLLSVGVYAENPVKKTIEINDKEIVERLTRVEEGLKNVEKNLTNRMLEMDKRLSGQMTQIQNMMWVFFSVMASGMFALVGFVIWDRRSALSPVININRELLAREEKLERALVEYAKNKPDLAKILHSVGLL